MMTDVTTLRLATAQDETVLFAMATAFNAEDGHPFTEATRKALRYLINAPQWGRVSFITDNQDPIGYLVTCFSFSVEFGGLETMVDELWIDPKHRGKGHASRALQRVIETATNEGCRSVYLEVMTENTKAAALYAKLGFEPRGSRLMTRRLTSEPD